MNNPHRLSETIASLVREMEEALAEGQMDRFQELAKRRSHALQALCMRNPTGGGGAGADVSPVGAIPTIGERDFAGREQTTSLSERERTTSLAGQRSSREPMAHIRRDILAKAIGDSERLIGLVALAKQEVGNKLEKLAVKKNAARQINQRYHQLVRSGSFCTVRG